MEKQGTVRERILNTVTRLFYDQGFLATGINQIIAEADIAKSSLYQHFRSKDELLVAYLTQAEKEWFEGLKQFIPDQADPKAQVTALFDYRISVAKDRTLKGCAFVRLAYELPNLDGPAAEVVRRYKTALRQYIRDAVSQIHPTDQNQTKELADVIYYLFEGSGVESTIFNSYQPIYDAKAIINKLITK